MCDLLKKFSDYEIPNLAYFHSFSQLKAQFQSCMYVQPQKVAELLQLLG